MKWHWLSSNAMTVCVATKEDRIVRTPPIVRKFYGQRLSNLEYWMNKQGGFQVVHLS